MKCTTIATLEMVGTPCNQMCCYYFLRCRSQRDARNVRDMFVHLPLLFIRVGMGALAGYQRGTCSVTNEERELAFLD